MGWHGHFFIFSGCTDLQSNIYTSLKGNIVWHINRFNSIHLNSDWVVSWLLLMTAVCFLSIFFFIYFCKTLTSGKCFSATFPVRTNIHQKIYQGLNFWTTVADSQAHWALCKHSGNACPASYYPHQTSTRLPSCRVQLPQPWIPTSKSRLRPTQADKSKK